jgi:uncharacterized membrane protein YraQ (UPF0718 family)
MNARREKTKVANKLNQQLVAQEDQRKLAEKVAQKQESDKYLAKKMSDFMFDVAKLIIGGVLLAGLMKQDIEYWPLASIGGVVVILFIAYGVYLIRKFNLK